MSMSEPVYIDAHEVRKRLTMKKAIEGMKEAFIDLSSGKAMVPDRVLTHSPSGTEYLFMPANLPSAGITTVKSVSLCADNRNTDLPFIQAVILVFDDKNGQPLAYIDGTEVTAIRTAAAAGAASDVFSDPQSKVGAIFGTGALAGPHLEAISTARKIEKVLIYGSSMDKASMWVEENQGRFPSTELVVGESLDHLREADIICTCTTSGKPLFELSHLKPGVHINAMGVFQPDLQEVNEEVVAKSDVYIDQLAGALFEAGDLLVPMSKGLIRQSHFDKEIGKVLAGEIDFNRCEDKMTLFKSVGNAIQDAAAAKIVLNL